MTLINSGNLFLRGTSGNNGISNNSITYEVLKYIPVGDVSFNNDIKPETKDSAGVLEGFTKMNEYRGFGRENSKIFVTMINSPFGVEVHSPDHTEPTGPGDQIGSDVSSSASEVEVGEIWGTETPSGDTNDISVTLNGDTNFVAGDGFTMRFQTRSRFSSVWGSFGSDVDPYLSVDVTETMRDNDIHFELTRNLGRLFTTNDHATQAFEIDQDSGAVVDDFPTSDNVTEKSHANDANVTIRIFFDDSSELDVPGDGEDFALSVFRRTKLTGGSFGSAIIGPTIGVDTEDDKVVADFGQFDYLFVMDEV